MDSALLQDDCTQCSGLCCLALSFEKSNLFAIDKNAGSPCPNLTGDARCAIHNDLDEKGFAGCIRYSCLGAGQRVTQEVFQGRSWQQNRALLTPMMEAFQTMRQVQELLQLLIEADKLALGEEKKQRLDRFARALQPKGGWTTQALKSFETGSIAGDIGSFLRSLRETITLAQR